MNKNVLAVISRALGSRCSGWGAKSLNFGMRDVSSAFLLIKGIFLIN